MAAHHYPYLNCCCQKAKTDNEALVKVMDLVIDISSHLKAMEHGVEELRRARSKEPETAQSASITRPAT